MESSLPRLEFYIDYGTKHLCVGAAFITTDSSMPDCRLLQLQGPSTHSPQIMGFSIDARGRRTFEFGHRLEEMQEQADDGQQFVVFERFKMLLFSSAADGDDIATAAVNDTLKAQCPDVSFDRLVEMHLAAIREVALSSAEREFRRPLRHLQNRTYFAVPEIASPNDTLRLGTILNRAGYTDALFISETEAAGAWYCHVYSNSSDGQQDDLHFQVRHQSIAGQACLLTHAQDRDELLVVDAGGSTCVHYILVIEMISADVRLQNVASFAAEGLTANGAHLEMRPTGRTTCEVISTTISWQRR